MKLSSLYEYAESYTKEESKVLQRLNRETHLKVLNPRMLAGHMQGRLLQFFSQMIKPKYILEIGTFTGYSAICLSEGLQKGGMLHTIEINPELEDIISKYFTEADILDKVRLHIGDALEIIPELNETFDLIYIDGDKENYVKYYELVFSRLKKGGFIIADNVCWDGKVLEKPKHNDKDTTGIIEFNKYVYNDNRVENLLLPFRDGLMIVRKK